YLYESSGDSLMDDIHYTNLMLELEKLSDRLNRVGEKLESMGKETENRVRAIEGYVDTQLREKYHPFQVKGPTAVDIQPEDFSNFLEFNKEKSVDFKNLGSFHLGAVADNEETKYVCIWEN